MTGVLTGREEDTVTQTEGSDVKTEAQTEPMPS